MISQTSLSEYLLNLEKWQFLGYIDKLGDSCYVVRLRCIDVKLMRQLKCNVVQDWLVCVHSDVRVMCFNEPVKDWFILN